MYVYINRYIPTLLVYTDRHSICAYDRNKKEPGNCLAGTRTRWLESRRENEYVRRRAPRLTILGFTVSREVTVAWLTRVFLITRRPSFEINNALPDITWRGLIVLDEITPTRVVVTGFITTRTGSCNTSLRHQTRE